MSGFLGKFFTDYCPICQSDEHGGGDAFYVLFRVVAGFLFIQHGAQKLFGLLGGVNGTGGTVELFSLLWLAGIIEFFGGLMIVLGIFTRLAALVAASEMIVAYFMVHFPQGFYPLLNKGELALFYVVAFLLIAKHGANRWSLEKFLFKKEIF